MKTLRELLEGWLEEIGRVAVVFGVSVVVGAGLTCGFFVGIAIVDFIR